MAEDDANGIRSSPPLVSRTGRVQLHGETPPRKVPDTCGWVQLSAVDPPPPEETLLQVRLLDDEDEARRIARELHTATHLGGGSFATGIRTRPAAASAWRPLRAVPNVNWALTTATARRQLALYSLKAPGIRCQLTLWDRTLRITATSS